ncbi:MAG TPA: HEAT repeat domain-containing protein [Granulicella sp.]
MRLKLLPLLLLCLLLPLPIHAQNEDEDDPPATTFDAANSTPAQSTDHAWSMLTDALNDTKHSPTRTQALAALSILGSNPRSTEMIVKAMNDPDYEVRTAAILAAEQTKDHDLASSVRDKLADEEPQVAFTAAVVLARMGDRTGADILSAVVDGERKATPGTVNSTLHTMNKDLHNPASIAKVGALQGAAMFLGPFGIGVAAYSYLRKNGSDSTRVTAIEELNRVHSSDIHGTLIDALDDKDPGVRAAAAKALAEYPDSPKASPLLPLFTDSKEPVRLTAAAAYLRSTGTAPVAAKPAGTKKKK